jgi:hypothetical protein
MPYKAAFLHQIYFSVVSVKLSQSTILIIITYPYIKSYTKNTYYCRNCHFEKHPQKIASKKLYR